VCGRVGIDAIAGPSEVVVLADAQNDPRRIAVDLLAQAEHDEAAQAILIADDAGFADAVVRAVAAELSTLPRAAIAGASWRDHGTVIVVRDWEEAAGLVDRLAPEHVQIMVRNPEDLFDRIRHAGAVFLGGFCPEALGDYVAGPNHVLPTGRTARFASGLSVFDFMKRTTWVAADAAALTRVGPAAVTPGVLCAWWLVSRGWSWNGWLRRAVVAVGGRAGELRVAGRWLPEGMSGVARAMSVGALLLAPGVWSSATAFASSGGALAQAGPQGRARGGLPARFQGAMRGDMTVAQRTILAYAQANSGGTRITLAVAGGASAAEAYLIHSDATVIGMGGFSGQDPAPTVATLAQWVQRGQLRFVLLGGQGLGGQGLSDPGLSDGASQGGVATQRTEWVQRHCSAVNPDSYGGSTVARRNAAKAFDRTEVLYDCQAG